MLKYLMSVALALTVGWSGPGFGASNNSWSISIHPEKHSETEQKQAGGSLSLAVTGPLPGVNDQARASEIHADVDTLRYELSEIEIRAARDTETEARAPFSVSVMSRSASQQGAEPAFSLDRIASGIPGLWVKDRQNYALGERISIRGMGWRAPFGVRGIYVIMDDIPLTVPDGQTVMDILDPAMVRQMEVIRGPSSAFWGNAGGGTLFMSTRPASYDTGLRTRWYAGSYGTYSAQVQATHSVENKSYHMNVSWLQREGYRDHSEHRALRLTGHMNRTLTSGREVRLSAAFVDAPDTRHPGSLTATEVQENRRGAASAFENASAGKTWRQGQLGLTLQSSDERVDWQSTVYGLVRNLHNPLPFADIEVNRLLAGARFSAGSSLGALRWDAGLDAAVQSDDRLNYAVTFGSFERGAVQIDQRETVTNAAVYTRLGTRWNRFNVSGGVRADVVRFENSDRLISGGEDVSGSRMFTALSPSVGVSLSTSAGLFYANYGSSFETPTTTELVNRPDMTGGFNPEIQPERAAGLEAGVRGSLSSLALRYEAAVFRMEVRDQLISYRTEEGGARDFFRNAGRTRHDGIEMALRWMPFGWMEAGGTFQLSSFTFRETVVGGAGVPFERGKKLPGIPDQRLGASLTVMPSAFRITLSTEMSGSYYADNANNALNPGYSVWHLQGYHTGISLPNGISLEPFVTVNNITNERYNSSVSINANASRYFEPAPGRALYAGFSLVF